MAGKKKYRRPDGSTYEQYGGPKSRRDVVVESESAAPATPSGDPTRGRVGTTGTAAKRTMTDIRERQKAERAQTAQDEAADVEKFQPWVAREQEKTEGGMGDAAARERATRGVSAQQAGDALATSKKKKEKK